LEGGKKGTQGGDIFTLLDRSFRYVHKDMFIRYKGKTNTNASRAFSLRMEKDSRFRLTKCQYKPPCTGYMRCSLRDVASIGMMFLEGTNNFK